MFQQNDIGQNQQKELLYEAAGDTSQKLAYKKLRHAEPGSEQPLQGSLPALFHYGSGAQGYGKEDKHSNDAGQELFDRVRATAHRLLPDTHNRILAFLAQKLLHGNFYALWRNVLSCQSVTNLTIHLELLVYSFNHAPDQAGDYLTLLTTIDSLLK